MSKSERKLAKDLSGRAIMAETSSSGFSDVQDKPKKIDLNDSEYEYLDEVIEGHQCMNSSKLILRFLRQETMYRPPDQLKDLIGV